MSVKNGTPSKTEWETGQCAQIQTHFIKALPGALESVNLYPEDVIDSFRDKDGILEQELRSFLELFIRKHSPHDFHITESLSIPIPALPRPTLQEVKSKFSWAKLIGRDNSPTDKIFLNLATILRPGEYSLDGEEYEGRVRHLCQIPGYQHAVWLVENQDDFPKFMNLPGGIVIDFPSIVIVDEDNGRNIPYLIKTNNRWVLNLIFFTTSVKRDGRLAVSVKC